MQYPNPSEYSEAVQNPHICFADKDLKNGRIETTPLGLPKPRSGKFATVYRLQNGDKTFAVRCFLKHFPDTEERYDKISEYLNLIASPYFVKFEYLEKGINVRGRFYPILKMEWAEGESFGKFVSECINRLDVDEIIDVRDKFVSLVRELREHEISHCDLQYGNILVTKQGLKLVDYDGMFVPTLDMNYSNEIGHKDYQHPKRTVTDFNEKTDNFSAIVIYTALSALIHDLNLWDTYSNEDNMLFTEKDFANPNKSSLFHELNSINDPDIRNFLSRLRSACSKPVNQCPDFLNLIGSVKSVPFSQSTAKLPDYINNPDIINFLSGLQNLVEQYPDFLNLIGAVKSVPVSQGTTKLPDYITVCPKCGTPGLSNHCEKCSNPIINNTDLFQEESSEIEELFQIIDEYCKGLKDGIKDEKTPLSYKGRIYGFYTRYRYNNKIFCCIRPQKKSCKVFLKLKYSDLNRPPKYVRDVANIGHHGVGDLELKIDSDKQIEYAKRLIKQSLKNVGRKKQ